MPNNRTEAEIKKDVESERCPNCGGKLKYAFGTARCVNDDWMCGDGELEEVLYGDEE